MTFGSPQERLAALLHEARMQECYGNWTIPSRFRWPRTREEWAHYEHNPDGHIAQAMAQAKAVLQYAGAIDMVKLKIDLDRLNRTVQ